MNESIRPDHGCFGCGANNPHGLHLRFEKTAPGEVRAEFTPRVEDEGFAGVVHGGILATMLDEAMAWAISSEGNWAVTARMEVRYRKPVASRQPLILIGRMLTDRGRRLEAAGFIHDRESGAVLAESTASFIRVPAEQARLWEARYLLPTAPAGDADSAPSPSTPT